MPDNFRIPSKGEFKKQFFETCDIEFESEGCGDNQKIEAFLVSKVKRRCNRNKKEVIVIERYKLFNFDKG